MKSLLTDDFLGHVEELLATLVGAHALAGGVRGHGVLGYTTVTYTHVTEVYPA